MLALDDVQRRDRGRADVRVLGHLRLDLSLVARLGVVQVEQRHDGLHDVEVRHLCYEPHASQLLGRRWPQRRLRKRILEIFDDHVRLRNRRPIVQHQHRDAHQGIEGAVLGRRAPVGGWRDDFDGQILGVDRPAHAGRVRRERERVQFHCLSKLDQWV